MFPTLIQTLGIIGLVVLMYSIGWVIGTIGLLVGWLPVTLMVIAVIGFALAVVLENSGHKRGF